tara:strand:+ start:485 stop:778 length:294 start_codon:yes stop_codon:yes gene_type:complete
MESLKYIAISNKYPEVGVIDQNGNAFHKETNEKIELDKSIVDQEYEKLKLEKQATQYQRDRLQEYPSIQECIHAILDDDLEALQAKRKLVKEKYPKP